MEIFHIFSPLLRFNAITFVYAVKGLAADFLTTMKTFPPSITGDALPIGPTDFFQNSSPLSILRAKILFPFLFSQPTITLLS